MVLVDDRNILMVLLTLIFREAMIPCILLALGGNLVDGKLAVVLYK